MKAFGAIILAAGLSSRMVENKLLLPWTNDVAIVRHVVSKYVLAGIHPVIVVTGRDAEAVAELLSDFPLRCVHNPDFETGEILSSVKVGIRSLPDNLSAAFIQPADMPCIPGDLLKKLVERHVAGMNVAPIYQGRRGHPVLLDRAYWEAMLALPGDGRPRDVIQRERGMLQLVEVDDAGVVLDVDSREAYERALKEISC